MADNKPKRLPKDFNQNKVDDIEITNPEGAAREAAGIPLDREYPKHLHKFAGVGQAHEFVVVHDAKEEAAQRKQGWGSAKEADADGRAQAEEDAPAPVKTPKAPKVAKAPKAHDAAAPKPKRAAKTKAVVEPGEPAAN